MTDKTGNVKKSCSTCLIEHEFRCNEANEILCKRSGYSCWEPIPEERLKRIFIQGEMELTNKDDTSMWISKEDAAQLSDEDIMELVFDEDPISFMEEFRKHAKVVRR
jgi:hypothetical protein